MGLPTPFPIANVYRVEVSGWDRNELYFVEKSELEWNEEFGKQLTLRRPLRDGAIVFVRLLQPVSIAQANAVAYKTEGNGEKRDGQYLFRLKPVLPRARQDATVS